jgi:hypothetical protein
MNREKIVSQLIKEGFSEKTLVRFNDNQLKSLAKKILSEQTVVPQEPKTVYDSKDPKQVAALNQALKNPSKLKNVEVTEVEGEEEEYCEECDPNKEEMNEWVKKVIEKNYHAVATKGAILETIKLKIQEKATMIPMPGKARKVRGIPEFMTYDSIVASTKPEEAPAQPETIPDTPPKEKPPRREDDPRRGPFRNPSTEPVPDVDPKAKAKIKKFNRPSKMSMAAE